MTDRITQRNFCESVKEDCARYHLMQALGKEVVPFDLHPIQMSRAEEIINEQKKLMV
jgi:hypothetical protein